MNLWPLFTRVRRIEILGSSAQPPVLCCRASYVESRRFVADVHKTPLKTGVMGQTELRNDGVLRSCDENSSEIHRLLLAWQSQLMWRG